MSKQSTVVATEVKNFYKTLGTTPAIPAEERGPLLQAYLQSVLTRDAVPKLPDGVSQEMFNEQLGKAMSEGNTVLVKILGRFLG